MLLDFKNKFLKSGSFNAIAFEINMFFKKISGK